MDFGGARAGEAKAPAAATPQAVAQPSEKADPKWEEMRRAREAYEEKLARLAGGSDAGSSGAAALAVGQAKDVNGAAGLSRQDNSGASEGRAPETGGLAAMLLWFKGGREVRLERR